MLLKKIILLSCALSLFFFCSPLFSLWAEDKVEHALKRMTTEEQCALDCFFRYILLHEQGIYVFEGTKPAAWAGFTKPTHYLCNFFFWRPLNMAVLLKRGYETWQKYQHLFPLEKYALLFHEEDDHLHIFFLNRKCFLAKITEHLKDFRAVLGQDVTPQSLFKKLENKEISSLEALMRNDKLMGLLLGFGYHNSSLFQEKIAFQRQVESGSLIPKSAEYIANELDKAEAKLHFPLRESKLYLSALPCYLFDPTDAETQALKTQYSEQRKKLAAAYKGHRFFQTTLKELTSK